MSQAAAHFPLTYPCEKWHVESGAETLRRLVKVAALEPNARLLHWGAGRGALSVYLSQELGLQVTAAEWSSELLSEIKERAKSVSSPSRLSPRAIDAGKLALGDALFDGVLIEERVPLAFHSSIEAARRYLAPKGRLIIRYPVRVGRTGDTESLDFFERRLGEPLLYPRDLLQVATAAGFASEGLETLTAVELESFYAAAESGLSTVEDEAQRLAIEEEIALFRHPIRRPCFSFSRLVLRRREPGEKPPQPRNE